MLAASVLDLPSLNMHLSYILAKTRALVYSISGDELPQPGQGAPPPFHPYYLPRAA